MKTLGILFLSVLGFLVVFIAWASSESMPSDPVLQGEIHNVPAGEEVASSSAADTLTVLAWNIGYGRGVAGDYAGPWSPEVFEENLAGMARVIEENGVDIALLQEVDLGASRSHGVHQGLDLARRLGWSYVACATTWSNRYVPFPYWPIERHYGAMHSGQCVVSRYPITSNVRYRLPQPQGNPFWYNWFYLHRAIQVVGVTVPGLGELPVVNVHLEAFSPENNLEQVGILREKMAGLDVSKLIVGGDFNALPPDASTRTGFVDEPDIDFTEDRAIEAFYEGGKLVDVVSMSDKPEFHTFPADAPTRRLDYIGVSGKAWEVSGTVLRGTCQVLSDHLPVVATLKPQSLPDE